MTDSITLRNIFGYSFNGRSFSQPGDTDGSRLVIFDGGSPRNTHTTKDGPTWSDEVQLIWTAPDGDESAILDEFTIRPTS